MADQNNSENNSDIDNLIQTVFPTAVVPNLVAQLLVSVEQGNADDPTWPNAVVDLSKSLALAPARPGLKLNKDQCQAILNEVEHTQKQVRARLEELSSGGMTCTTQHKSCCVASRERVDRRLRLCGGSGLSTCAKGFENSEGLGHATSLCPGMGAVCATTAAGTP